MKADQFLPGSALNGLAAVIAEAHVNAFFLGARGGVEHDVDGGGGPFAFVGMACDVGFVNLNDFAVNFGDLPLASACPTAKARSRQIAVMMIHQRFAEHVRSRSSVNFIGCVVQARARR